jgi:DNA-damage-inducible protein J
VRLHYIVILKWELQMAANALVQTRIDPAVKERAATVLDELGLTVSDAVRIMLTRTANEGALPFDLAGSPAHDRWFRDKMREALAGLEDGSNAEIGEAEWKKISARKRAELNRLISGKDA